MQSSPLYSAAVSSSASWVHRQTLSTGTCRQCDSLSGDDRSWRGLTCHLCKQARHLLLYRYNQLTEKHSQTPSCKIWTRKCVLMSFTPHKKYTWRLCYLVIMIFDSMSVKYANMDCWHSQMFTTRLKRQKRSHNPDWKRFHCCRGWNDAVRKYGTPRVTIQWRKWIFPSFTLRSRP